MATNASRATAFRPEIEPGRNSGWERGRTTAFPTRKLEIGTRHLAWKCSCPTAFLVGTINSEIKTLRRKLWGKPGPATHLRTPLLLISPRMSSSTVDFKSGWVPAIGGEELAPCKLIERIVQDCLLPSPLVPKDRPWTRVVLNSYLNRHLESKEAVWEAIVALWRLKSVQEDGVFAASWRQHVLAWIVCLIRDA